MIKKLFIVWSLCLMSLAHAKEEKALFAMGCFWCGASEFGHHDTGELIPGILKVTSGYGGGTKPNPIYEDHEGHREVVQVIFDSDKITYAQLLEIFWHNVDPFDDKGQFCDKGFPYMSAIYASTPAQRNLAEETKKGYEKKLGQKIVTEILDYTTFTPAEEYHQNYHLKNPVRYQFYRWNCGRDKRLEEVWGKP